MSTATQPRVLIVDDSELVCESLKPVLEAAGFSAVAIRGPYGFIKAVREANPAIILIDIGLGTLDGTRLVQLARQHSAACTRILLYSGREDTLLDQDAKLSGADGFISKRVVGTDLAAALRGWLAPA